MKKYIYILLGVFLLTIGTTSCGEDFWRYLLLRRWTKTLFFDA